MSMGNKWARPRPLPHLNQRGRRKPSPSRQGHSILITWNSAIIENTQDNISKSSVFIDADVFGCINMRHQTTFNALYSAPDEPCGCRNSHMHINEIFVSNDPGLRPGKRARLVAQHVEIMLKIKHMLAAAVTALVTRN